MFFFLCGARRAVCLCNVTADMFTPPRSGALMPTTAALSAHCAAVRQAYGEWREGRGGWWQVKSDFMALKMLAIAGVAITAQRLGAAT